MKQTAVEWLYERLERMIPRTALYNMDKRKYFEQAKEMHKEEIIKARLSLDKSDNIWDKEIALEVSEQYYKETFNTNEK